MSRILLLGKHGQLGFELQKTLAPLGELISWGREDADLDEPTQLLDRVLGLSLPPDWIVNAAAYTAVDKAQTDADAAKRVNTQAPAALACAAKELGAKLVHFSTDYVFDGTGEVPWTEDMPTAPQNVYGRSKRDGELAISASGCQHLIFRTSWVYGQHGGNFAKTMLRLACEREKLSVVDDQIGAPTDAAWLAGLTAQVMQQAFKPGLYHAAAAGAVSWHGYARHLIEAARELGFPIQVASANIQAVQSSAFPTPAARPQNSRLDCSKLTRTFGITPPPWQQGIASFLSTLQRTTTSP